MASLNPQLVLGTAQLGFDYGIANKQGQPNQKMAETIIQTAWNEGIYEFDTAQEYGQSEKILGEILVNQGIKNAHIISKLSPKLNHTDHTAIKEAILQSLARLQVPSLYAMMLHREELLDLWDRGLANILLEFVKKNLVQKIGVSVYNPEQALRALKIQGIDLIQIPTNIWDRRFIEAGIFEKAEMEQKDVYIRSVFLQGLLTLKSQECPERLKFAKSSLKKLDALCQELKMSRLEIALVYVRTKLPNARMIIGVESADQIQANVGYWKKDNGKFPTEYIENTFSKIDPIIVNPALWPLH